MKLLSLIFCIFGVDRIVAELTIRSDCHCGISNERGSKRIINGKQTTPHKYPWMAELVISGSPACGGSVISDRHIITAAHCFTENMIKTNFWSLGIHELSHFRSNRYNMIAYQFHPRFNRKKGAHEQIDLMITTLQRKINFGRTISTICLPKKDAGYTGRVAIASGWGKTERGTQSPVLLETSLPVISNADCEKMFRSVGAPWKIYDKWMICTFQRNTDTCQGDSGGPLTMRTKEGFFELIGATSFGIDCAKSTPGVYARISTSETLKWIVKFMNKTDTSVCPRPGEKGSR